jgi:fucose 4-O-acetylase-like acetyltransferase
MKEKLNYISFLQFIGPLFVIIGHSTNSIPSSNLYHTFSKVWIYVFHIPLFFFISGYMFSYNNGLRGRSYFKFIFGKFRRLLIPYLVWNLLFIVPKAAASSFIIDDVEFKWNYFIKLIITPRANIWGHTWFLAALFILFTISPLFNVLIKIGQEKRILVWGIITITLVLFYNFPLNTELFALRDLSKDILFFWVGVMLGQVPKENLKTFVKKRHIHLCIFLSTLLITVVRLCFSDLSVISMITCLLTILTLFIIPIVYSLESDIVNNISQRSFGIYIMHWPVMLLIRIMFYQIMNIDSRLVIFLMVVSGIVVPNIIIRIFNKTNLGKLEKPISYLFGI